MPIPWKSLLIGREAIANSVRWSIGSGESINIRTDKWLRRGLIGGPANRNDPKKVSELILPGTQAWNEPLVRNMFDDQTTQEILATPINGSFFNDELVWTGTQNGSFTVKNGYNLLRNNITENTANQHPSSSYQTPSALWHAIWHMKINPKVKFFIWRACQNALPTKENLWKRRILPDPLCDLCRATVETTEHTLLLCPWAAGVWNRLPSLETIGTLLWQVWKSRNDFIFRGTNTEACKVIDLASTEAWMPQTER